MMNRLFLCLFALSAFAVSCAHHRGDAGTDTAGSSVTTSNADTIRSDSGTYVKDKQTGQVTKLLTPEMADKMKSKNYNKQGAYSYDGDHPSLPYYIRGTLVHGEGGNVTLDRLGIGNDIKPLFVETVNKEAKYAFDGSCSQPQLMQLRLPAGSIHFIIRPGDTIDITSVLEKPGDWDVKGSIESKRLKEMYEILEDANGKKDAIEERLKNARNNLPLYSQLVDYRITEYAAIDKVKHANLRKFINRNDTSFVCMLAAMYLDPMEDIDFLKKLDKRFVLKYPTSPFFQAMHEKVTIYGPIANGMVAPEIISKTSDEATVKLSSFRGKYVLIDFWASWCSPCRNETPNLRDAYAKYKDKGFEILSYSLDNNKLAWTKAIKDDKMNWTNVSDLLGFQSAAAGTYVVTEIPDNFLLDREGHIIARNLRGAALTKKLAQVIK